MMKLKVTSRRMSSRLPNLPMIGDSSTGISPTGADASPARGGIAVHLLQQLRQQHDGAEVQHVGEADTQAADGEVARLEQRQIHHRMVVRQLPHHREQQRHHRDDGERDDLGRVEPVQLLALIEHDLQRTDADDQQYRADGVDRFDLGFGFSPFNVAIAATITKTPIGMLMKKIQPQW